MTLQLRLDDIASVPEGFTGIVAIGDRDVLRIGRQATMDMVLPDDTRAVSSLHCEIRRVANGFELHDMSTNGTFLNGDAKPLDGPQPLADGDRIRVAGYVLAVSIETPVTTPPLPVAASDETQVMRPTRPLKGSVARLTVSVTADAGWSAPPVAKRSIELPGGLLIGREATADLVLPDQTGMISRRHCEIRVDADGCVLHDNSINGVLRETTQERLATGARLFHGDRLRIGGFVLALEIGVSRPDEAAAPAADPDHTMMAPPRPAPPAAPVPAAAMPSPSPAVAAATALPRRGGDPAAMARAALRPADRHATGGAEPAEEMTAIVKPKPAAKPVGSIPHPKAAAAKEPATQETTASTADSSHLAARIAQALGVALTDLAQSDPATLAEQLAMLVALTAEEMHGLLRGRADASRSAAAATNNNPLELFPTADEALRVLLGPPRRNYLDANRAFRQSFIDLRDHQSKSDAAMRTAAKAFADSLAPWATEEGTAQPGALRKLVSSRKAQLWDLHVARWSAMTGGDADGAAALFERMFRDAYQAPQGG